MINTVIVTSFFQSITFKRTTFILGVLFLALTLFISINPEPFLQFGYLGVFIFNLFGPGTLLFPSLVKHMNMFGLVLVTSLGMVLNDSISWVVGRSGDAIIPRSQKVEKIEGIIHKYGPVGLFFWSLIPIPYDIIGLIAGYLEMPYKRFIIPTFLGKLVRFILLGSSLLVLLE
jgi:membrane protein YqaA with SNARE-associated domain